MAYLRDTAIFPGRFAYTPEAAHGGDSLALIDSSARLGYLFEAPGGCVGNEDF